MWPASIAWKEIKVWRISGLEKWLALHTSQEPPITAIATAGTIQVGRRRLLMPYRSRRNGSVNSLWLTAPSVGLHVMPAGSKVDNRNMSDQATVNVGVAGSITMIILCLAVGLLLWNFYRRYKRMQNRNDDQ